MRNIEILETNVELESIIKDLHDNPNDWGAQRNAVGALSLLDRGFPTVSAGVLQLVMGGVKHIDDYVGDSEICIPTVAIKNHKNIADFMTERFGVFSRCGFLSLPVGGVVGTHIDIGDYYLSRDRYHLSIQGVYKYTVGDESIIVEPGTLFRFNNKLPHGTSNIGDVVRITFVFDVPHNNQENIWQQ